MANRLLPYFVGTLLALPPLSALTFAFIQAWWLRIVTCREQMGATSRVPSFWLWFCGCLRTAARTAAVTFAVTAVVLALPLTYYRTKATTYLRELPTKERKQMDKWLAGIK
jgi:hypothetical protein